MAFISVNDLIKAASVLGTEKIPVSKTQYIDIDQIVAYAETSALDLHYIKVDGTNSILSQLKFNTEDELVSAILSGELRWDLNAGTLSVGLPDGGSLQIGKEVFDYYVNVDTIPLTEGMVVSIKQVAGNRKAIKRTDPAIKSDALNVVGVVTVPSIAVNGTGRITKIGEVSPIDTSAYTENDTLYVSHTTIGTLTKNTPPAGFYTIKVGSVVVSTHNGTIDVRIDTIPMLGDLSDVTNNATEGQPLTKQTDGTWKGSNTIKVNTITPPVGTLSVNGNLQAVDVQVNTLGAESASVVGDISVGNKLQTFEIESTTGYNITDKTNNDIILARGDTISIPTLKTGIYQLYNPTNNTQVVLEINAAGQVLINGDIIQNGSAYETHAENINTPQEVITLRSGATTGLGVGELAGFVIKLYDGVNDGQIVIDNTGTLRIGDVGDLQPVTTREESPVDTSPTFWNSTTKRIETIPLTETKSTISDADRLYLTDSDDNNKPKSISGSDFKDHITDEVSKEFLFFISEDDISITVGIGDAVLISESTEGYPSIVIESKSV